MGLPRRPGGEAQTVGVGNICMHIVAAIQEILLLAIAATDAFQTIVVARQAANCAAHACSIGWHGHPSRRSPAALAAPRQISRPLRSDFPAVAIGALGREPDCGLRPAAMVT